MIERVGCEYGLWYVCKHGLCVGGNMRPAFKKIISTALICVIMHGHLQEVSV